MNFCCKKSKTHGNCCFCTIRWLLSDRVAASGTGHYLTVWKRVHYNNNNNNNNNKTAGYRAQTFGFFMLNAGLINVWNGRLTSLHSTDCHFINCKYRKIANHTVCFGARVYDQTRTRDLYCILGLLVADHCTKRTSSTKLRIMLMVNC